QGVTKKIPASGHDELWDKTLQAIDETGDKSIIFTNFVDFDMLYGHRNDVDGYARALEAFDRRLPEIEKHLKVNDVVIITADHGNDPTWEGTDHTREQVPLLVFGKKIKSGNLGQRNTFADVAQTLAEMFKLEPFEYGTSFWKDIK
ncbi:MAG: phosphopentomutase, partial [Alphaproteobacteria bacterium]|nr:phosphopentomutase [Alphaproteobacteria bacterium]